MSTAGLDDVKTVTLKLLDYCKRNDWAGYDPYDALNSELFKRLPFLDYRFPRIIFTQLLKRSPLNLRRMLLIPKTQNPKAIALFLQSLLKLSKLGLLGQDDLVKTMVDTLVRLRSPDISYYCWGYSFPWQGRAVLVPRGAPNLVCTVFVTNALLDAYDQISAGSETGGRPSDLAGLCKEAALSAAEYILNDLYWTDDSDVGLSYPLPSLRTKVHNANFLGAALFARVYGLTGDARFLEPALRLARYSAVRQREDGSWGYGELSTQTWVDNFHTGYNLCALRTLGKYVGTTEFEQRIRQGFVFYRDHFFREDGAPRYFHNRTYPIDAHSVAQSIITLLVFKDMDDNNVSLAHDVLKWALATMWDERGFFYYQVLPVGRTRTSYMRWTQAWMCLGLSTYLEHRAESGVQE